ncbi:MAG: phage minor head protein [Anaerotignum propionicum]|uniref:phage minor head protein n=1 Tax=Anaerotignum propionicum TaxID=28446 RepID=UPI002B219503|nr:phage minor head protein [Anaerotignum propionicum]MEA5058058.1 phage minor head protein [Anaerotignum propionicum]
MSTDYWGKRLADKAFDRSSEDMLKELRKIYRSQSQEIQNKVTDLYLKMIEDGGISTTNLYAYGRSTELMREINTILKSYGEKEIKIVSGGLESVYREVFGKTSEALGQTVKWGLQNTYIMEEVVNANLKGANFSNRIWKNRSSLLKNLEKNIQDVVASGQSKDSAIKHIMSIEKASFRNADRLVRTETMRVINDGQKQSFTANGYTHGYYIYSDDDRNCEECERISKESRENPQLLDAMDAVHHPNCRCTIRPVVPEKTLFEIVKENGEYSKYEAALKNKKSN